MTVLCLALAVALLMMTALAVLALRLLARLGQVIDALDPLDLVP